MEQESIKGNLVSLLVKIVLIIITAIILCMAYSTVNTVRGIKEVFAKIEKDREAELSEYIVYGTHLNIKGNLKLDNLNIKAVSLAFNTINGKNEKEVNLKHDINEEGIIFSSSELINEGIDLEKIDIDTYYIFIKIQFLDDTYKYYTIRNNTEYKGTYRENIEYYTITKNAKNNKIDIEFDRHKTEEKELPYMKMEVVSTKLPEDVYDIVIDPGHGGGDPGAQSSGYDESNLALKCALDVKEELEELGLKVKITRDRK